MGLGILLMNGGVWSAVCYLDALLSCCVPGMGMNLIKGMSWV